MPLKKYETCPSCGSRQVRWRATGGKGRMPSLLRRFFGGVLRGQRMHPMTPGLVTRQLTTIWDGRTKLTPDERAAVDELVLAKDLPSDQRRITWSCAACESKGEFVEESRQVDSSGG